MNKYIKRLIPFINQNGKYHHWYLRGQKVLVTNLEVRTLLVRKYISMVYILLLVMNYNIIIVTLR